MQIILEMNDKMKEQRENYLNWYVDMFCDIDDKDAFKSKVIDELGINHKQGGRRNKDCLQNDNYGIS